MSGQGLTPPGTVLRLVIPEAVVVAHGDLRLQFTMPGHPGEVIHLPLVDGHYRPLVEVHPYVPQVHAGQVWRTAGGVLLFGVLWREQPDDVGVEMLIAADGGAYHTPAAAVETYGPLELVVEHAPVDNFAAGTVYGQARPVIADA
ncbi:hypothetical protein ACN261_31980 [Micromonospora sp. WMMD723]|uniref:hypothetical protein n=1 Tax=Micromonospora sp. WMMD723 TaxID=3403465 RepID=UPI003CED9AFB